MNIHEAYIQESILVLKNGVRIEQSIIDKFEFELKADFEKYCEEIRKMRKRCYESPKNI